MSPLVSLLFFINFIYIYLLAVTPRWNHVINAVRVFRPFGEWSPMEWE